MDIAKYIGLYLLKNKFCYIHGLGNLELRKRPAAYDGQALQGPAYEVVVTPTGSIDDNLANFIATNEQISISKAANGLREFSTKAKADLHEGKDVIIPSLGKFTEQNGRIQFITDPHLQFTPPSIPTVKTTTRTEEKKEEIKKPVYTTAAPSRNSNVNWGKVIVLIAIVVVLIAAVVWGINYLSSQNKEIETLQETPAIDTPVVQAPLPAADTTTTTDSAVTATVNTMQNANGMLSFKVILNSFKDSARAAKRVKTLTSYGNTVEVAMQDSAYHVVMPVTAAAADTAHLLDSLKRTFNPKGVSVLR